MWLLFAGKAARTLAAWLKSEALKRQNTKGETARPLTVCVISSARITLDAASFEALCRSVAGAGVGLRIFCCAGSETTAGRIVATEVLAVAPVAAQHGARITVMPDGVYNHRNLECSAMLPNHTRVAVLQLSHEMRCKLGERSRATLTDRASSSGCPSSGLV